MSTQTMQVVRVYRYGGPGELKLEQVQRPEPQANEVLVRVHAAGVNPVDWKIREGWLKDIRPMQFPYVPGNDIAGVIEEVGPGVTAFQKGQAIFGQANKGAYAEYTTASVEKIALKPQTLSCDEAATVPLGATTAWQSLFDLGNLQTSQRVLIQGAAGGVGLFAVQFAKWKGAQVIGTASASNIDFIRSLGIDTPVDYSSHDLENVAQDVDLVVDGVGGKTVEQSLQLVKRGGTLVTLTDKPSQEKAQQRNVRVLSRTANVTGELLQTFAQLIDEGKVKIEVAQKLPLSGVQKAQELSERGHGRGRIVLHIAD